MATDERLYLLFSPAHALTADFAAEALRESGHHILKTTLGYNVAYTSVSHLDDLPVDDIPSALIVEPQLDIRGDTSNAINIIYAAKRTLARPQIVIFGGPTKEYEQYTDYRVPTSLNAIEILVQTVNQLPLQQPRIPDPENILSVFPRLKFVKHLGKTYAEVSPCELTAARQKLGLTQAELARMAKCSPDIISKLERHHVSTTPISTANRILKALGLGEIPVT